MATYNPYIKPPVTTQPNNGVTVGTTPPPGGTTTNPGAVDMWGNPVQGPPVAGNNWIADHGNPPPPSGGPPVAQTGTYPQPNPSVLPPPSPHDPFMGPTPVPPASPAPPLNGAPGGGMPPPPGNWNGWNPYEKNQYGGQQIAGADPNAADYGSVQGYADQAYDYSRRYLDPQQDTQNKRMSQDLINQGIDPNSPQGQERMKMMGMQQADQNNAAAFGAMQFGQGIQNQMFNQEFQQAGLAGDMQKSLWAAQQGASGQGLQKYLGDQNYQLGRFGLDNQRYGIDMNYELGKAGQDLTRYGYDLSNQFNQGQLDLQRQGQDWNQMMGLDAVDFRNQSYNDSLGMYQDQLMLALMGQNPAPGGSQVNPYAPYNQQIGTGGGYWNWNGMQ